MDSNNRTRKQKSSTFCEQWAQQSDHHSVYTVIPIRQQCLLSMMTRWFHIFESSSYTTCLHVMHCC